VGTMLKNWTISTGESEQQLEKKTAAINITSEHIQNAKEDKINIFLNK
jgi:hypothetical protein